MREEGGWGGGERKGVKDEEGVNDMRDGKRGGWKLFA